MIISLYLVFLMREINPEDKIQDNGSGSLLINIIELKEIVEAIRGCAPRCHESYF